MCASLLRTVLLEFVQCPVEQLLQVLALLLDLEQVAADVRVVLQVAAEVLGRLAQGTAHLLNLVLVLLILGLVRKPLEHPALCDQCLIPRLQTPLLLDDARDRVAHELGQLVAVRENVRGDAVACIV